MAQVAGAPRTAPDGTWNNCNRCGGITYKFCARVEMMSSVAD
jgi:hypothetical protein